MNILFYVEPWIEKDWPSWKDHWIPQLTASVESLERLSNNYKFLFVIGDAQQKAKDSLSHFSSVRVVEVTQAELKNVFPDYKEALDSWYQGTFKNSHAEKMKMLLQDKVGSFKPDLIWTFMSPVPFMENIFPGVPVLHQEVGALTGGMYPKSWFLDPLGVFRNSFPGKFAHQLLALPQTTEATSFLKELRSIFKMKLNKHNPFTRQQFLAGTSCEYLLFFPLQYNGHFGTDSHNRLPSQFDLICHILDRLDPRVALVVSEHVNPIGKKVLNSEIVEYLKKTYPNFVYDKSYRRYPRMSQFLIDVSDAVISVSSTMGLQALFWGKALFVVGDSHLAGLSHDTDIGSIYKMLKSRAVPSRDPAIYHLLTHYYILHDPYFSQGLWLQAYIQKAVRAANEKASLDFPYFDRIDSDEAILAEYRRQTEIIDDPPVLDGLQFEERYEVILALKEQISVVELEKIKIQDELHRVYASKSWRFTAGLRYLSSKLKRLLG